MTATYHFSSEQLIRSCPLPKSMFSHKSQHSLTITASKVEPLSALLKRNKKHLEYNVMEKLIETIGRQLHQLELDNKGIAGFNLDDITVFYDMIPKRKVGSGSAVTNKAHTNDDTDDDDDNYDDDDNDNTYSMTDASIIHFAITNEDKIHDIDEEHQLTITAPYQKEYTTIAAATTKNIAFHSPEFKEFTSKKTLPYTLHFKSGYYSFGLLCVYCYISRSAAVAAAISKKDQDQDQDQDQDHEAILSSIVNTKIYWFLKRVLEENPSERRYICV